MTLSDQILQGHSSIASFFKLDFSYSCVAAAFTALTLLAEHQKEQTACKS